MSNKLIEAVGGGFDLSDKRMGAQLYDDTIKKLIEYFEREMDDGTDVKRAIAMGTVDFPYPTAPGDLETNKSAEILWKLELTAIAKRKEQYRKNMASAYSVIFAICSEALQSTLENSTGFDTLRANSDSLGLLTLIKQVMFTQKEKRSTIVAMAEAQHQLITLKQNEMTVQKYFDTFNQSLEILELCGGSIGIKKASVITRLNEQGTDKPTPDEVKKTMILMRQELLAAMFLAGSDERRFALLKQELANDYVKGQDNYPKSLDRARQMLANRVE